MHKLFLCLRYLKKRRIAFFGIAAVALCVALLIVITSLFNGFIGQFRAHWRDELGDVDLSVHSEFSDWDDLQSQLKQLECVSDATAVTSTGGLLYLGRGDVRAVEIVGIDPDELNDDQMFRRGLLVQRYAGAAASFELSQEARQAAETWLKRKLPGRQIESEMPIGAILGIGLLGKPDEMTDEYDRQAIIDRVGRQDSPLFIVSGVRTQGADRQSPAGVKRIRRMCWPVDVVETGNHYSDTLHVYLPFDYVGQMVGTRSGDGKLACPGSVRISGAEGYELPDVVDQVRIFWRQFKRQQTGQPEASMPLASISATTDSPHLQMITREIRKQLAVMQVILGLICVVVAMLVFVILFMIVMQKKRDIGIVRAVGASRCGVAAIFLGFGATVGVCGAGLGVVLGFFATRHIAQLERTLTSLLGFKVWQSGVYFFRHIPNRVDWDAVVWIVLVGVLTATVGALLPAVRAARLQPVDALRYE